MTSAEIRSVTTGAVLLALAAALPFVAGPYWLTIGVTIAMYAVLATSWALFSGPTHYISLATAAFFGLGTYTTGIGIEHLPYWALPFIAAVLGAVLAALVGLATLRLSGVYFVIFTLGLAEFAGSPEARSNCWTGKPWAPWPTPRVASRFSAFLPFWSVSVVEKPHQMAWT